MTWRAHVRHGQQAKLAVESRASTHRHQSKVQAVVGAPGREDARFGNGPGGAHQGGERQQRQSRLSATPKIARDLLEDGENDEDANTDENPLRL
jgi:hypothetical protein